MEIRIDFDSLILNLPQLALDINGLEQFCLEKGLEVGRRLLEAISARMDEALMKARPPGYTIVGSRTKTLATRMGDLRINRRLYRDEHGGYHSLLDEYLGLDKYQRATHGLMREALVHAAQRSGVEEFFRLHLSGTQGKVREKRERLRDYLLRNWEGIEGWRIVCERLGPEGLGAIEGNVDKCAVRRFKDRGCCWSEDGVHALAEVRFSWLNGELDETLRQLRMSGGRVVVEPPERRLRKVVNGSDFWQRGAFPALRVSMERPWQRVLRGITSEVRCP